MHDVRSDTISVLRTLDAAARRPLLLYGPPPPDGRDLDVVVSKADVEAVAAALLASGFDRTATNWVRFRGCSVALVDLIRREELGLPPAELDALLREATPYEGLSDVLEPAPHHRLLILATKVRRGRAALAPKHRGRIEAVVDLDVDVWEKAGQSADAWGVVSELNRLRDLYEDRARLVRPSWLTRPRRTRVVALSGPSTDITRLHAEYLSGALEQLGYPSVIATGRGSGTGAAASGLLAALRAAASLWRGIAPHLGRRSIVVFDGYALDHAVRLAGSTPTAIHVIRAASPRALRAFLLVDEAEAAAGANGYGAYRRFGARAIDASSSADTVCAELLRDVWHALGAGPAAGPSGVLYTAPDRASTAASDASPSAS